MAGALIKYLIEKFPPLPTRGTPSAPSFAAVVSTVT
jgi:hypothetical protein